MRFIIHELPYEKPVAAGRLRYEQAGAATGAVETWRLTEAVDGYRFLRVDLDARAAASGHSYLYHLTVNPHGRTEQLKYRFWGNGLEITGQVVLEDDAVIATRDVNGRRYENVVDAPVDYAFWFPSSVGLGLLARHAADDRPTTAVSLRADFDDPEVAFGTFTAEVRLQTGGAGTLTVGGKAYEVRPLTIRWDDETRTLWLDAHDWPLKMARGDGLTAVETRYIRYQRITTPDG